MLYDRLSRDAATRPARLSHLLPVRHFGPDKRRITLHAGRLIEVEDGYIPPNGPFPSGYESRFQICVPYFGLFSYSVGRRKWMVDANQALFVTPGWEAEEKHPVENLGHASLILNPSLELLTEIAGGSPREFSAFQSGTLAASARLKLLCQQVLRLPPECIDPLYFDEWAIEAISESLRTPRIHAGSSSKLVARVKELLHACSGQRLRLDEIAAEVGVSPVYLTQEFKRQEGTPLYRYQLRLRLANALLELPDCHDITGLALDLGFSSHSHFTASFGNAFGLTPTEYRSTLGTRAFRCPGAI